MGVVFRHTVEAFVEGVVLRKGVMSKGELQALGVYPPRDQQIEVWASAMRVMSSKLTPGVPEDVALEESGRAMIRGFAEGLVGRGLVLALRLIGRRRALLRMAENFRAADSVMHVSSVEKGPGWVQIAFGASYGLERHMLGIMRETMVVLGKDPCTVEGAPDGKGGYVIDVKWAA